MEPLRGHIVRFPKKREWAALVILYDAGSKLNLGEALDILRERLCVTKRTARRIVGRLRKLGLLKLERREDSIIVSVQDPLHALRALAERYANMRRERCSIRPRAKV